MPPSATKSAEPEPPRTCALSGEGCLALASPDSFDAGESSPLPQRSTGVYTVFGRGVQCGREHFVCHGCFMGYVCVECESGGQFDRDISRTFRGRSLNLPLNAESENAFTGDKRHSKPSKLPCPLYLGGGCDCGQLPKELVDCALEAAAALPELQVLAARAKAKWLRARKGTAQDKHQVPWIRSKMGKGAESRVDRPAAATVLKCVYEDAGDAATRATRAGGPGYASDAEAPSREWVLRERPLNLEDLSAEQLAELEAKKAKEGVAGVSGRGSVSTPSTPSGGRGYTKEQARKDTEKTKDRRKNVVHCFSVRDLHDTVADADAVRSDEAHAARAQSTAHLDLESGSGGLSSGSPSPRALDAADVELEPTEGDSLTGRVTEEEAEAEAGAEAEAEASRDRASSRAVAGVAAGLGGVAKGMRTTVAGAEGILAIGGGAVFGAVGVADSAVGATQEVLTKLGVPSDLLHPIKVRFT